MSRPYAPDLGPSQEEPSDRYAPEAAPADDGWGSGLGGGSSPMGSVPRGGAPYEPQAPAGSGGSTGWPGQGSGGTGAYWEPAGGQPPAGGEPYAPSVPPEQGEFTARPAESPEAGAYWESTGGQRSFGYGSDSSFGQYEQGGYEGGQYRDYEAGAPRGAYPAAPDPLGGTGSYYEWQSSAPGSADVFTDPAPREDSAAGVGGWPADRSAPAEGTGWQRSDAFGAGGDRPSAPQETGGSGGTGYAAGRYRDPGESPEARISRLADPLNDPLDGPRTAPRSSGPPETGAAPAPEIGSYGAVPFGDRTGGLGDRSDALYSKEAPDRYDDELSRPRTDRPGPDGEAVPYAGAPGGGTGYPEYGTYAPGEADPAGITRDRFDEPDGGTAGPEERWGAAPGTADPVSGLPSGSASGGGLGTGSGNTWAFNRDDFTLPEELRQAAIDAEEKRRGGAPDQATHAFRPDLGAPAAGDPESGPDPYTGGPAAPVDRFGDDYPGLADRYLGDLGAPDAGAPAEEPPSAGATEQVWPRPEDPGGPEPGAEPREWGGRPYNPSDPGLGTQEMPVVSDDLGADRRVDEWDRAPEGEYGAYGQYTAGRIGEYGDEPLGSADGFTGTAAPGYGYDEPPAEDGTTPTALLRSTRRMAPRAMRPRTTVTATATVPNAVTATRTPSSATTSTARRTTTNTRGSTPNRIPVAAAPPSKRISPASTTSRSAVPRAIRTRATTTSTWSTGPRPTAGPRPHYGWASSPWFRLSGWSAWSPR
ncbi:hypothetical protein [Allosalinactinospora lopnorensis]|uniref:hypothetical protein n=1 Tax=Allosalinactinospora lopnorensis TaxID=1352348 RepID=UPI0012E1D2CC|nr:hypothetical protein [Allosalinactinospora lopnorensis]